MNSYPPVGTIDPGGCGSFFHPARMGKIIAVNLIRRRKSTRWNRSIPFHIADVINRMIRATVITTSLSGSRRSDRSPGNRHHRVSRCRHTRKYRKSDAGRGVSRRRSARGDHRRSPLDAVEWYNAEFRFDVASTVLVTLSSFYSNPRIG